MLPRFTLLLFVFALTGCGSTPTPPVVDTAAEKDDEQRIKAAGQAERKATPKGKGKAARNPDDD